MPFLDGSSKCKVKAPNTLRQLGREMRQRGLDQSYTNNDRFISKQGSRPSIVSADSRSDIFAAFHRVAVVASNSSSYRPRSANISIQNGVQGPLVGEGASAKRREEARERRTIL
ncbi:uncharacterized protein LOC122575399 isoform X2 [Bombus pyrosoma]|uniref:uncharacterized protein LOC122575399 isoform X2 n=1 Tax=Bombus pyrosoma TaxID=396416 RepID=UPI001CB8B66C|nr:uncharacterized protein LOC122575399 isoform X2 [Bombus pyrosoma]